MTREEALKKMQTFINFFPVAYYFERKLKL